MQTVRFPLAALAAASVAALSAPALQAQTADPYGSSQATAYDAPGAVNTGQFSIEAGAEWVSNYVFRGLETQDDGIIFQPWAEIGTELGDSGFDLTLGIWSSLGSAQDSPVGPNGLNSPSFAFETDLYVGTTYVIDQFTLGANLTGYYSPGGFFGDVEELSVSASFDDEPYFEEWSFNPYALLAFEIRDENVGESEDIYLELGGAFSAPFIDSEEIPVDLTFPVVLGFSLDDFYTDNNGSNEFFGFLKIGAQANTPLDFVPAAYGAWTASAAIDLYFYNGDANLTDNGDDFLPVFRLGVSLDY